MTDEILIRSFVEEAREYLDEVEPTLIELKQNADATGALDDQSLDSIFRLFHSIKGSAGFFQFDTITALTHEAESLLDVFRQDDQDVQLSVASIDPLCRTIDLLRAILTVTEEKKTDQGFEDQAQLIVDELKECTASVRRNKQGSPSGNDLQSEDVGAEDLDKVAITNDMLGRFQQEAEELLDAAEDAILVMEETGAAGPEQLTAAFRAFHSLKGNCGFMGLVDLEQLAHRSEEVLYCLQEDHIPCSKQTAARLLRGIDSIRKVVRDLAPGDTGTMNNSDTLLDELKELLPSRNATEPIPAKSGGSADSVNMHRPGSRRDIRVDLDKLDALINLVGELVIAESMVINNPDLDGLSLENFERAVHQMQRITNDLQDVALAARMVPLAATFRKMIRLVHDLANRMDKSVRLEITGDETEVDKTVIEQISDPLIHIIRNAVDHAIESPSERRATGKPEMGVISLEARHQAGEVWILISDDGRGLDREAIFKRAVERGLIDGKRDQYKDEEIYRLIFEPGFSTADKVSDISGRGVGMDVVKRNLEALNGRVRIRSRAGKGTTIILRIPLTLAVIDGMLIRVGSARYTVPMLSLRESFRPEKDDILITPDGQEVVKLRDRMIPVVRLHRVFAITPEQTELDQGILLLVEDGEDRIALFVDQIASQQQAVIKGLNRHLGRARGIAGCTILGNGEVSLILDISTLLEMASES